jgi:general secretion pathway protein G
MPSILSIVPRRSDGTANTLRFSREAARIAAPAATHRSISPARARRARGFTLIEILVVVVILGILAMIVVPRVMEEPGRARVVRTKQDIASIVAALNIYKLDNFIYPSAEQGLEALVTKPSGQPDAPNWSQRLDRLPKDPWGHPYQYQHPGQHGEIDVFSYGADGKAGGDGEAADIGNWDS